MEATSVDDPDGNRTVETAEVAAGVGRARRRETPRSELGKRGTRARDPLDILDAQNAVRRSDLVPLRMERMAASPFAFYRGTAAIMAADLAQDPTSGLQVVCCGDAHLSNFGLYASPQRTLVFDLNDFDEASAAPFEWDLKRLATSVVVGGRENGYSDSDCADAARATVASYREALAGLAAQTALDRYYTRIDVDAVRSSLPKTARRVLDTAAGAARKRTGARAATKITEAAPDGSRRFIDNPPVQTHGRIAGVDPDEIFREYLRNVSPDIALLLSQHAIADVAVRVVGVGSVGTRCHIVLLTGPHREALILQIKEAQPSVLQSHGGVDVTLGPDDLGQLATHQGRRVIAYQRILQAVSDPFLGHVRANGRDYYVRQFRDMKGSVDLVGLALDDFVTYSRGCAVALARAHAQSPGVGRVVGYAGRSAALDRAITAWSVDYADQALDDFRRLRASLGSGRPD